MSVTGIIGVSCNEHARYAEFWAGLDQIERPAGTVLRVARGSVISMNRNELAKILLDSAAQWLFYVDDDQIIPPDTLLRLLAHLEPIVSALYLDRRYPFGPHIYRRASGLLPGRVQQQGLDASDKGLVRMDAVGAGALLVRRDVFERMKAPYWRLGQLDPEQWSDDIEFCQRARKAGFRIHVDLDAPVGHKMDCTVWPAHEASGWVTQIEQQGVAIARYAVQNVRTRDPLPFAAKQA